MRSPTINARSTRHLRTGLGRSLVLGHQAEATGPLLALTYAYGLAFTETDSFVEIPQTFLLPIHGIDRKLVQSFILLIRKFKGPSPTGRPFTFLCFLLGIVQRLSVLLVLLMNEI